jgi:hypothetical protein
MRGRAPGEWIILGISDLSPIPMPAMADPATSRPPRPGRAPDITPRSTSRPDHVLAVRAGDDVHEAATLDEERGVPVATSHGVEPVECGGDVVALVARAWRPPLPCPAGIPRVSSWCTGHPKVWCTVQRAVDN